MRLFEEHNQQHLDDIKEGNSYDFENNSALVIQGLRYDQSNSEQKEQSCNLLRKREGFHKEIRRQYLRTYFDKKRVQMFGFGLNSNKNNMETVYRQFGEIQIDNYSNNRGSNQHQYNNGSISLNKTVKQNYSPVYCQNYFKDIILLEKLISSSNNTENQFNNNNDFIHNNNKNIYDNNHQHQPDFRFRSFYQFVFTTIQQNLDHKYFSQINNRNIDNEELFLNHFNTLKHILYKKLAQQMEDFLISVQQFNSLNNKKNMWAYHNILLQTYTKLIYQITQFIKTQNLQYGQQNTDWPIISIDQQLTFLINMLISVAYFDQVQNQEINQILNYDKQQNKNGYKNQQASKKVNRYFQEQDNEDDKNKYLKVQMTRIIVKNTELLDTLKFLIVFGTINQSGQFKNYQNKGRQNIQRNRKRRQGIIMLIIILLRNLSVNIGSDILFQVGLVAELKCILKQPYFNLQIRRQRQQIHSINSLNKKNNRTYHNKTIYNKPLFHYRIEQFLTDSFQMIRQQQSQQYLSQMDSFQFVFDLLDHVYLQLRREDSKLQQQRPIQKNNIKIGNELQIVDYGDNDNNDYGCNSDSEDSQYYQMKQMVKDYKIKRLIKLAQQCVQCLRFHFYLGQIKINQTQNQHSQVYQQQFDMNNDQSIRQKNNCMFSTKNRYVVKFNYIPNGQQLLKNFQQGQQLLKLIHHYNY